MPEEVNYNKKLRDELKFLNKKHALLKEREMLAKNSEEPRRAEQLLKLYQLLEKAGVDPTDVTSIRDFLNRLYERNPDLAELFENAFNGIMGVEGEEEEENPFINDLTPTPGMSGAPSPITPPLNPASAVPPPGQNELTKRFKDIQRRVGLGR